MAVFTPTDDGFVNVDHISTVSFIPEVTVEDSGPDNPAHDDYYYVTTSNSTGRTITGAAAIAVFNTAAGI